LRGGGGAGRLCSLVHFVVDASPSMGVDVPQQVLEADASRVGEEWREFYEAFNSIQEEACKSRRRSRPKLCLAYASLVATLEALREHGVESQPAAASTMVSVGVMGGGWSPEKDYLVMPPRSVADLVSAYAGHVGAGKGFVEAAREALGFTVEDVLRKAGGGESTNAACAVRSLEAALEASREAGCAAVNRVLLLCLSDCCVNAFQEKVGGDVVEHAVNAREELVRLLEGKVRRWGVAALLYGDPTFVEMGAGVCPIRAALIVDLLETLKAKKFDKIAETLEYGPGLAADPEWANLIIKTPSGERPLRDYAVRRVVHPGGLVNALVIATTTTTVR